MRPFNLLQYPARDRQRKIRHRWMTFGAGLTLGMVSVWGVVQWGEEALGQLQQDRTRLQAQLQEITLQQQASQKQQVLHKKWDEQAQHLSRVAQQQAVWQVLHRVLLQEPHLSAVRFSRLQTDTDKFELHGFASDFSRMDGARERLSRALMGTVAHAEESRSKSSDKVRPPVLVLGSLVLPESGADATAQTVSRATELEFVWQGVWPSTGTRPTPPIEMGNPAQGRKVSP